MTRSIFGHIPGVLHIGIEHEFLSVGPDHSAFHFRTLCDDRWRTYNYADHSGTVITNKSPAPFYNTVFCKECISKEIT